MTHPHRPITRALLISAAALALFVAGCAKKPVASTSVPTPPPPAPSKPTVSLSADRSSVTKGDSLKLSWTSTDAANLSIAPEVGAVTAQGSTTVTPSDSVTYTITATGPGGTADSSVRITVNAPPPPPPAAHVDTYDELFLKDVRDAYFDYDSAAIRPDARVALQATADFLKNYPQAHVTIEGHCDERGSTEYNLALGDRRATAVKQYLVSLGIPADHLNAVSFGKEKPFCLDSDEACYAKNRRGHFVPAR